jgi:hypothetical protein
MRRTLWALLITSHAGADKFYFKEQISRPASAS